MKFTVLTLFPELVQDYFKYSILADALQASRFELDLLNPRDFSTDKHKKVDDIPYGGGAGMVLSPQPFCSALDSVELDPNSEIIITSPSGRCYDQELAEKLATKKQLVILCGRYEGFDQRIRNRATVEISIGDYVLTGGELAALTIIDSVARLLPSVLGDQDSSRADSFSTGDQLFDLKNLKLTKAEQCELELLLQNYGIDSLEQLASKRLLEYPHYTRPADFQGGKVPEVLLSGDHKRIALWRLKQALSLSFPGQAQSQR